MQCYVHPEMEAVATCANCGKAVCNECAVDIAGQIHCKKCVSSNETVTKVKTKQTASNPTNPLAIISLVLGILGLLGCFCGGAIGGLLFGIPATITGWIGRKQLLESGENQQNLTFANIGLILGGVEVALSIVLLIIGGSLLGLGFLTELLGQQ